MCKYGYVRISTPKQNIERQVRNIEREYPGAIIIREAYTGAKMDRKGWNKLFASVKAGDTIVFDSVSRMSRNAVDGFTVYEELFTRGVNLVFLKEPHISTSTYQQVIEKSIPMTGTCADHILKGVNRYLLELAKEQIRLAFEQAEKEVEDLRQRTKEGIETARLRGKQPGRRTGEPQITKKSIAAKEVIRRHSKDFCGTLSDIDTMKLAEVSRNTYYKYKRELAQELAAEN